MHERTRGPITYGQHSGNLVQCLVNLEGGGGGGGGLFTATAVNEEDLKRDRATPEEAPPSLAFDAPLELFKQGVTQQCRNPLVQTASAN